MYIKCWHIVGAQETSQFQPVALCNLEDFSKKEAP